MLQETMANTIKAPCLGQRPRRCCETAPKAWLHLSKIQRFAWLLACHVMERSQAFTMLCGLLCDMFEWSANVVLKFLHRELPFIGLLNLTFNQLWSPIYEC